MKNIYIIIWLIVLSLTSSCQAFVSEDKTELQNYRMSNVFLKLSQLDNREALYIYDSMIEKLESWKQKINSEASTSTLWDIITKLKNRKTLLETDIRDVDLTRHKTTILKFWRWWNTQAVINTKKTELSSAQSVFIFRNGSNDLTGWEIESITKSLYEINPDMLIFIDQEGWLINRYVEFDGKISFVNYLTTDDYVRDIYDTFSQTTKTSLWSVFPAWYTYFPSLTKVGEVYLSLPEADKQNYLDLVAYLRLKTLSDRGVNTYWFVMDLDRGNPVIKNYRRSFSSDLESYKKLWDSFIKASKKTWVSLYLKHFPGHWAGQVDSHKWILDYTNYSTYLSENLELFEYMLDNKQYAKIGLMIGHMYIPKTLQSEFISIIGKSDYLLTDDLAMRWYTLATWWLKDWVFFTTDVVFDNEKTILVDSVLNPNIK